MIGVIDIGGRKTTVLIFAVLAILFSLFISACTNKNLGGITGNVVREGADTQNAPLAPTVYNPPPAAIKNGCADSDNGDEPSMAGTTTVVMDGSVVVANDVCTGDADLMEHYCVARKDTIRGYTCKYGCREGRCLTSSDTPGAVDTQLEKTENTPSQISPPQVYTEQKEMVEEQIAQTAEQNEKEQEQKTEQSQNENYNCYNGFKDTFESDVDCGTACPQKCGYGKMCSESTDCAAGLKCNQRIRKCMQRAY
ncbi:MAG: hypothetical protein Q7R76_01205 [Candidatus Woesearchaeota archaeon]|nr:hypothetical protein [Candidatus Woesearchaeota archaeon]